jgi:hypothetical protein
MNVGDTDDDVLGTAPDLISTATGSFPAVTGVTGVQSTGGCGSYCGSNAYSLQLNSGLFPTAACDDEPNCSGFEQFVFFNPPTGDAFLFIQDWLVAANGTTITCPPGHGWTQSGADCVQNSPLSLAFDANYGIAAWLGKFAVTGSAGSSGDSIILTIGIEEYGYKDIQGDGITDLASHWQIAEFNVFGAGGGSEAVFNPGVAVQVSVQADDGVLTAPTCSVGGNTEEYNNLNFVTAPSPRTLQYPSILFEESNVAGGSPSCDQIGGSGVPTPVPSVLPTIPIL